MRSLAKALEPTGEILFEGLTINEFSSGYDFSRAKDAGIGAVVLRATAGPNYTDPNFPDAARRAQDAGLRLGFYHYLVAQDEAEARAQAHLFTKAIEGYNPALRPAMLFEALNGLSFDAANRIARAFLSEVESILGIAPAIYTDAESASLLWNRSLAESYPLWVIDETHPDAPQAGDSPWKGWVGWQYRKSLDPGCREGGTPVSRFTAGMLAQQIVVPGQPDPSVQKLICITVVLGDTLTGIARLFNTTVDAIVQLNAIANPNRIFPGQRLYLRVADTVPYPCCDSYTVRRGDTLSAIAERFDVDWRQLASINEIPNPDLILPGQVIKLGLCSETST